MAASARCTFLVILLSATLYASSALQCYSKLEATCSPAGQLCDNLKNKLVATEKTSTPCPEGRTMCASTEASAREQGVVLTSTAAGCLQEVEGFISGCYGRGDLAKIDPVLATNFLAAEEALGIIYGSAEICICKGDLCNGSRQKAALDSGATSYSIGLLAVLVSMILGVLTLQDQL